MEEEKIDASRIEYFNSQYTANKGAVRALLASTTFSFAHIVGIDWRLDYYIKSHTLEKANTPMYFISLKTQSPHNMNNTQQENEDSKVEFTASLEQMQDLINKLKDAAKQVERSANTA
jgi:glycyl-tRNA synthetase (class II)